ncbi:sensor histidine kinase [Oricola cellulosilytica]|uniref:histidine kinase n=1 Tax=Oricola cellulosilytica TaxID=1429082 RepID=A0A4R0PKR2_9HYPH|nr:ATP-binding protein [Oricola cellulosilytica]TCD16139.1 histidine kinase [Oricola cellulosilytica]
MKRLASVRVTREQDIVRVRQIGQLVARTTGFSAFAETRVVTAWLELARNILQHGGGGRINFALDAHRRKIAAIGTAIDEGPGIERVDDLLQGRRRPADKGGLGLGLRGVHRMADRFDIRTGPEGTRVEAGFLSERPEGELLDTVKEAADAIEALDQIDPAAVLAQQNDDLMRALSERDLLIAEIHHRTRNNLALVSSLVRLSRSGAKQEETRAALKELEGRINAIIQVHQQLQHAETSGEMQLVPLLEEVVAQARRAFSAPNLLISTEVTGDQVTVGSGAAVALGLIVGELITNAMKHGFAGRSEGRITVSLDSSQDGYLTLVTADDGNGLPAGQDRPERSSSLGWRMIRTMADKYGGQITTDGTKGLRVTIRFDRDLLTET